MSGISSLPCDKDSTELEHAVDFVLSSVVCDTPEATSATAFRCVQLFPFVPSFGP